MFHKRENRKSSQSIFPEKHKNSTLSNLHHIQGKGAFIYDVIFLGRLVAGSDFTKYS